MVKKKILITGNCGYVGSILTEECLNSGYEVVGYDLFVHGKEHMADLEKNENLKIVHGDIRDYAKIEKLISDSDYVIHLAGIVRVDDCTSLEKEIYEINTEASIKIAQLCKKYNKKMVFASSCSVYGLIGNKKEINESSMLSPTTIYAKSKLKAEEGIFESGAESTICRFATAYGQSQRMRYDLFINEVLRDAVVKKKIILFDPKVWRCYVHIRDMARAIIFFIERGDFENKIYNVGSNNQNLTKEKIIDTIKREIGEFDINILRDKKDPRNYKINFDKIEKEGFKAGKEVLEGIREMNLGLLNLKGNPYDEKFTNYKSFNYSIESENYCRLPK